jgi:Kef-type K+ transport system membrane component KefB
MFDSTLLLFQVAVIIGVSRLFAWIFGKFGQP